MTTTESKREKLQNIAVPDDLLRKIKAKAALKGQKIREFVYPVLEALVEDRVRILKPTVNS